jgi:hypothetical protein
MTDLTVERLLHDLVEEDVVWGQICVAVAYA